MSSLVQRLRRLRSRLAVRIYLVGLAQFAIVAAGLVLVAREGRRADPSAETLRLVADSIAAGADDPRAVATAIANAEKLLDTKLGLFDERHRLVAGTAFDAADRPPPPGDEPGFPGPPGLPGAPVFDGPPPGFDPPSRLDRPPREPRPGPPWDFAFRPMRGRSAAPVLLRDGRVWRLLVTAPHPLPSVLRGVGTTVALVLLVVGVSGWVTARGLARPLAQLSSAAHAFGAGDLTARASLARSDELGDVSTAFDEMAERVTRALRAEKELLANVSHELRTPLQRIQIAIDLAAEGDATTARESLDEIAEDLAELGRIVEDVLASARLSLRDGGGPASPLPPIHVGKVDLGALLRKSESRFRALHPSRPLVVEAARELPEMAVDSVLVRRAVDNLLDNAHKYTDDAAASVLLSARADPAGVVVEIRDRGIGIGAEDQRRLFEPFFRADRSRTRGTGGLGLGLLLARRIVEAHGGTLTLKSAPGEGTTARVELPRPSSATSA